MNLIVRTPLRRYRTTSEFDPFQHSRELQLRRVKDPCAVARLEDEDTQNLSIKLRSVRPRRNSVIRSSVIDPSWWGCHRRHWFALARVVGVERWCDSCGRDIERGAAWWALGLGLARRTSSKFSVIARTEPSEVRLIWYPSLLTSAIVNPGTHLPSSYRVRTSTRAPTRSSRPSICVPFEVSTCLHSWGRPDGGGLVQKPQLRFRDRGVVAPIVKPPAVQILLSRCGDGMEKEETVGYALGIVTTNREPRPSSLATVT
jgi:hypothetical protein